LTRIAAIGAPSDKNGDTANIANDPPAALGDNDEAFGMRNSCSVPDTLAVCGRVKFQLPVSVRVKLAVSTVTVSWGVLRVSA
jgi:hypothetical protein